MKAKKILATCLAVAMMLSAAALPTSASEVPQVSSSIASTTVASRNVQRNWTNLSIGTSYTYLDTGNNYKISNWYGSYATFVFENKSSSDTITLRITDYDQNGNQQHSYIKNLSGNGGSATVKVTPGGYYMVEARSNKSISGVNLSTYTEK